MAYSTVEQPFVVMGDGRKAVTTAGTRVQLSATSVKCRRVEVKALTTNSGVVVVGSSTVVAAAGSERGVVLFPGDGVTLLIDNLNKVYIDSTSNGDAVSYIYYS